MELRPLLRTTLLATLLWLPAAALAQVQPAATAATDAADMAALRDLQQTAQRLTILNQVPEALRADAAALLDRAHALHQQAADLNRARLEAYVAALQEGSAPAVARAEAQQHTAEAQVSLAEAQTSLRADVVAFTADHPELQGLFARVAARGGTGMHALGMRDGSAGPGRFGDRRAHFRSNVRGSVGGIQGGKRPAMRAPMRPAHAPSQQRNP